MDVARSFRRAMVGAALAFGVACGGLYGSEDSPIESPTDAGADVGNEATNTSEGGVDIPVPPPAGACPGPSPDPSIVLWYPFEDGEATRIVDCSGQNLHGKLLAADAGAFQRVPGRDGKQALDMSGSCFDLGVAPPLTFAASSFTVSAWLKPRTYSVPDPTNPKPRWFLDRYSASGGGWSMGTDDKPGELGLVEMKSLTTNSTFVENEKVSPKGAWFHVAGVFTPTKMSLWFDGKLAIEKTLATPTPVDPKAHAWLGCRAGVDYTYDGLIDELRVYSRALSATEIAALSK